MENNHQPTLGNGKICYLDIPAIDIGISATFYQEAFGWIVRQRSDGSTAFDDAVNQVSGTWTLGRSPSTAPGIIIYIMVDDITKSIEAVITNGGRIVQPVGLDAPEITARFSDPAGNVLGMYQQPNE